MSKDLAVADGNTDLAVVDKAPASAPALRHADVDVRTGTTIGTVTEDDTFALDHRDTEPKGRRQVTKRDDSEPDFRAPTVEGHQWKPEDKALLASFDSTATELGLSDAQRDGLARWLLVDAQEVAGVPTDASHYEFNAEDKIENSALARSMSGAFKTFALGVGLPAETANSTVDFFISESKTQIDKWDAEHRAASVKEIHADWGDDRGTHIKQTQAYLNGLGDVGKMLKGARTSDGKRLIYSPGIPRYLHGLAMAEQASPDAQVPTESASSYDARLRKEATSIRSLRSKDRDGYFGPYKDTGVTGDQRLLQIEQELADRAKGVTGTSAAQRAKDVAAEKAELLRLEISDPESWEFGKWRGTSLTPMQRLAQIARRGH